MLSPWRVALLFTVLPVMMLLLKVRMPSFEIAPPPPAPLYVLVIVSPLIADVAPLPMSKTRETLSSLMVSKLGFVP